MDKLKVLIVNKYLYSRGGDCIYSLNLGKMLKKEGHDVAYFSMRYPLNNPFPESDYFVDEVSFTSGSFAGKTKAALRVMGFGVKKKFNRMLDDFRPDVVHLNNIHSYISPVVAKLAHRRGIRVIWTLHDYKLFCPAYTCLRKGKVCEECLSNRFAVVSHKCFKDSLPASILGYLERVYWSKEKLFRWTDALICPSDFMECVMEEWGYPEEKLAAQNNFIDEDRVELIGSTVVQKEAAYCYVGRLSPEKGVEGLLQVASKLPYKLYIAGEGPLADRLKEEYATSKHIVFLGNLPAPEVIKLFKSVCFSIIPSVCYENNPLSVIESLCCGTPVTGSETGGIPSLIDPEWTSNHVFVPGDLTDMKNKITWMFDHEQDIDREQLSRESLERFSWATYYRKLITLYTK